MGLSALAFIYSICWVPEWWARRLDLTSRGVAHSLVSFVLAGEGPVLIWCQQVALFAEMRLLCPLLQPCRASRDTGEIVALACALLQVVLLLLGCKGLHDLRSALAGGGDRTYSYGGANLQSWVLQARARQGPAAPDTAASLLLPVSKAPG